jgi:DUF438 domain-containing protein
MTTPILPEFVLHLFQHEVTKIVNAEVKKVCELYELNYEEVIGKLGQVELETTDHPGFRIMKKNEKIAPKDVRCIARMLHDLEVKQCTRKHCEGSNLCKRHHNMRKDNRLKYGTINDPIPDELRSEVLNEKKKNTIY